MALGIFSPFGFMIFGLQQEQAKESLKKLIWGLGFVS